jgi:RNA polymerase sigma-70 factor, ECF subfamily
MSRELTPLEQDVDAVLRARAGDPTAFESLLVRYSDIVYALAAHILEDVHEAEDVVQEAFLQACLRLQELQDARCFAPWLRRIAVRLCWAVAEDRRRRRRREQPMTVEAPDPYLAEISRAEGCEEEERWICRVRAAVDSLSEECSHLLALFYIRNLSHEQIAHFLQVPEGTVKRRLFDARKELQEQVGPERPAATEEAVHRMVEAFRAALRDRRNGAGGLAGRRNGRGGPS